MADATDGFDASAEDAGPPAGDRNEKSFILANANYRRLWIAQVVSSLGDWIGMVAVLALAARLAKGGAEVATGLVMIARFLPGFLLAPVAGVLVDRWDRRHTMVACDVGRGLVLGLLPFLHSLPFLFAVSFLLEIFTLLWQPAKEASVPNLVRQDQLVTANSLGMAAAYGTFPIGAAVFALLAGVASLLSRIEPLDFLKLNQENVAIWFDCLTFFTSAVLIYRLHLPRGERHRRAEAGLDLTQTWRDLKEGVRYIRTDPVVRIVMFGMAAALLGGAAVIPLGVTYATKVLHGGPAAYGLVITALGTGTGIGVILLSSIQHRLPKVRLFSLSIIFCGAFLFAAASISSLAPALLFVSLFGLGAGAGYVCGFAILQEEVEDHLRGRTFAALFTIIRLDLLIALGLAPLLAGLLEEIVRIVRPDHILDVGVSISLSGTRLTLWLGGLVVVGSGITAMRMWRKVSRSTTAHEVHRVERLDEAELARLQREREAVQAQVTIENLGTGPEGSPEAAEAAGASGEEIAPIRRGATHEPRAFRRPPRHSRKKSRDEEGRRGS